MFKRKLGKEWQMDIFEERKLTFKYFSKPYLTAKFTLAIYGWLLPDDYEFYKLFKSSVENSEMHRIFSEIQFYQLCYCVKGSVGHTSVDVHSIPCEINLEDPIQSSTQAKTVNRSLGCRLLLTLLRRRPISYRNQSIDLLCKSMDWFLYDIGLRRERVK